MPICFVSLITLYELGFDKLDDLSDDIIESINKAREVEISNMIELQFVLSYRGNISKADSDEMTPFELKMWYNFLKKQGEIEADRVKDNTK